MEYSGASFEFIKKRPIEIPQYIKILSDLKEAFNITEVLQDEIIAKLKEDGDAAEQMRRFVQNKIAKHTNDCRNCALALYEQHTRKVPGEGSLRSPLMLIGEGPGFEEDKTGKPFVGKAGQLLTVILEKLQIPRETIYITNVIKCRPPDNRTPFKEEINACSKILRLELDIVCPKVIITLGSVPLKYFNIDIGVTRARGKWVQADGIWVMPTYHPAYILRLQGKALINAKWDVWHDFNVALEKVKELCPDYYFK